VHPILETLQEAPTSGRYSTRSPGPKWGCPTRSHVPFVRAYAGISKPKKFLKTSTKGMDPKFLRNQVRHRSSPTTPPSRELGLPAPASLMIVLASVAPR
jgi:hypothetical protein